MIRNSLEIIEYIDKSKSEVIYIYKNKYQNQPLRENNIRIVVRRLFEIIAPNGKLPIDRKHRQRVVIKVLNQLTSDSYIESFINYNEFNNLNNIIDRIDIDDIEEEVYRNIETSICNMNRCC